MTLPRALKQVDRNYRTAHFGKFGSQMGADPKQVGFDESDGWTTNSTGGMPTPMEERGRKRDETGPQAGLFDYRARDRLREATGCRAAAVYVQLSHYAAHLQVQTRPGSLERFEKKGSPDRAVTHAFGGMLYDLDEAVGRMLDALKELGAAENTYVILMGDNGGRGTIPGARDSLAPPNRPLNGAKHYLLEAGFECRSLSRGRASSRIRSRAFRSRGMTCYLPSTTWRAEPSRCRPKWTAAAFGSCWSMAESARSSALLGA